MPCTDPQLVARISAAAGEPRYRDTEGEDAVTPAPLATAIGVSPVRPGPESWIARVPASYFGIVLGLAGLSNVWRAAARCGRSRRASVR